jgi:hypothetical protein
MDLDRPASGVDPSADVLQYAFGIAFLILLADVK